ncbi:MAG: TlyA family RNA methyltransferase [Actinomycetota bacterium]|nr:TlyA family RNA methyltransferase [Actinomycetota bacterium]
MKRLDQWLVEEGYYPSREKARLAVMAGEVEIEGKGRRLKAATRVGPRDKIVVKKRPRFVSRGGEKLEGALERWGLSPEGKVALDVGASTGGFTQCLLERGASGVIALDVGKGQLHWDLRRDPRVEVMEGTNVRYLDPHALPERPRLITVDVSFISLELVIPVMGGVLSEGGDLLALIKPQFEAGRGKVGKGGIVREPDVHREVLRKVLKAAEEEGFHLRGLAPAAPRGAEGNIEFFGWWSREEAGGDGIAGESVEEAVGEAWNLA